MASVLVLGERRAKILGSRLPALAGAVRAPRIRSHLGKKHLATILEELGWERVAAHPGTWVHKETKALLAVYVADLLMTAPPSHEKELWKAFEARISFDEEPSGLAKFLGVHHDLSKRGNMTTGKVQMSEFLHDAVARYLEETGEKSLSAARTLYLTENFGPKGGEEPGVHANSEDLQLSPHGTFVCGATCETRPCCRYYASC